MGTIEIPDRKGNAKFAAVAFDLDGTLYPDFHLFVKLIPFLLKNHRLLQAMGTVRNRLRASHDYQAGIDFYDLQARLMADLLGKTAAATKEETERLIYRGWESYFTRIKLFPHLRETLDAFRNADIPLGLLSDFPPDQKLANMKLSDYWDVTLSSEETGRLKPDPLPFLELARRMNQRPEDMLYVGNNARYDVEGALSVGMKAALILPAWMRYPSQLRLMNDEVFVFKGYRQLCDYVLQ